MRIPRSCWLELAELCVAEKQALPTWPEITALCCPEPPAASCADSSYCSAAAGGGSAELQEAKVMYACFLVHAYLEKHCGDLAMQVLVETPCSGMSLVGCVPYELLPLTQSVALK